MRAISSKQKTPLTIDHPIHPPQRQGPLHYHLQLYLGAVFVAGVFFATMSVYLYFRRGYYDLYIANKIFAGVSAILLGIVVLLGPLSRLFTFPDHYIQYRKELGIVAFFLAFIHGIVSFLFLPSKFPLSSYLEKLNWPFVFGFGATLILLFIFAISNHQARTRIGPKIWWPMQYIGIRVCFALVVLHVFVMKWNGWVSWYRSGGTSNLVHPEWPGAGLFVGWFMAFVILVRIAELVSPRLGRVTWYVSVVALPVIYVVTFWWGSMLRQWQ